MRQSGLTPSHTAIIMDGNGRWAARRGLPRCVGHREGARALRRAVEAAPAFGIRILTLYAFSSDNWNRPRPEVEALMELLAAHLRQQAALCRKEGVRMRMIGRRDRLPAAVLDAAGDAETQTAGGDRLDLRLAVDYSGRDSITRATTGEDVDLLIRTGGEQRLSDFLIWESAYAELVFTPCLWPDFDAAALADAVAVFKRRDRRYGRVPALAEDSHSVPGLSQQLLGQSGQRNERGPFSHLRGDRWLR